MDSSLATCKRVAPAALCAAVMLAGALAPVAWAAPPHEASTLAAAPAPLRITTTLAHLGYIGVTVSGPAGAQVRVQESRSSHLETIAVLTLGSSGTATLPHALSWRCDRTQRRLLATTMPPAPAETATAQVRTPSCARRLVVNIDRRATVGAHLTIRLRDRWRLGSLPMRICVAAPGAGARCGGWRLRAGTVRRTVRYSTPRPGGWTVTVRGAGGLAHRGLVWAEHRGGGLRLYAAGDSEMQILDDLLAQTLGPHGVHVRSDARISTGLTKPFFFNWPRHARGQAAQFQPDVSVFFIGANDGFPAPGPHGPVSCCGAAWSSGYASLAAQMMHILLRGDAGRVYWFTLPAPVPGQFSGVFSAVNAGIRRAARRFPGRVSVIDANAFFTPGNRYRNYMTWHGRGFVIHEQDGVHLSASADAVAAQLVLDRMRADHLIR